MNKLYNEATALPEDTIETPDDQPWQSEKRHSDVVPALSDEVDLDTLLVRLTVAANPYRILALLRALHKLLAARFETEESADGPLAHIGRWAPHLYPAIDRRRYEHREILATVTELEGTVAPLDLRCGVASLVLDIQLHEVRETDLVQEALDAAP
ncbi:MAG: hypothetical protein JRI68_16995 [Deltaproteobacteria bacterium]|nr:hypothetical protein [Deltaproteobacteria bacterium]